MTLTWTGLPALFPGFEGPARWLPLLQEHWGFISAQGPHGRATAVPPDETVGRNYAESLELLRLLDARGARPPLADVGSGAGFPGIVIAILRPAWQVHLVEPLQKRAALLVRAAGQLGLANVTVHACRAEQAGRGPLRDAAGTVTARAVAPLRELLEYTAPLAAPGALLALPKGSGLQEELALAGPALEALSCRFESIETPRPGAGETPFILFLRKRGPTGPAYPRRAGVPHRRPL